MQIFLDKIKKPRNRKPRNGKPRKTRDYCIGFVGMPKHQNEKNSSRESQVYHLSQW